MKSSALGQSCAQVMLSGVDDARMLLVAVDRCADMLSAAIDGKSA